MKDYLWKLIELCTNVSIAFAIEQSPWMPTCSELSESTLIPHPTDCRKFFVCIEKTAYSLLCPYGLNWDPTLNKCSTQSICENKQNIKISRYNPLCPIDENPENSTYLPDNNDCRKFYQCQKGYALHMICPDRKHWSIEHQSCKDASIANCKNSLKSIGNGQFNAACPLNDDPQNPTHLAHPEDCTKFLKCSFGRSYIVSCPLGLHWDVVVDRCESPFIAQCENTSKVSKSSSTTSPPPPIIIKPSSSQQNSAEKPSPNLPIPISIMKPSPPQQSFAEKPSPNLPICPKSGIKNYGIPGQCDKYFSCSQGKLHIMMCRKGRQWSELVSGCVDSKIAGCTGLSNGLSIATTTNRSSNKPLISSFNTHRPLVSTKSTSCTPSVVFLSHPTDCHKFFVCDNGKPVEMSCPDGLFFSHTTSSCQWNNIDC